MGSGKGSPSTCRPETRTSWPAPRRANSNYKPAYAPSLLTWTVRLVRRALRVCLILQENKFVDDAHSFWNGFGDSPSKLQSSLSGTTAGAAHQQLFEIDAASSTQVCSTYLSQQMRHARVSWSSNLTRNMLQDHSMTITT